MGSSREYWQYARECPRWAARSKDQEDQDLFINMAKAWTNIALVTRLRERHDHDLGDGNTMEKFKSRVRNTLTLPSKVSRHGHMNGEVFGLVQLSELPQTSIRWRWPQRIPTGMVTVVAGYQKTGKSLVACDIAATITRGGSFPAGEGAAKRGHVIIINNEDDRRQMLGPRLAAAGADLNRIHIPNSRWVLNRMNLVEKLESEIKKIQ